MAVLSDGRRASASKTYQQLESQLRQEFGALTKADIRAAVDAVDAFFDTNASAINNAIPLPARTVLTTAQKARLINLIIYERYIVGVS